MIKRQIFPHPLTAPLPLHGFLQAWSPLDWPLWFCAHGTGAHAPIEK